MTPFRKILYSLHLDYQWLSIKEIPIWQRIIYIFRKYTSLLRHSTSIQYLGRQFKYDNTSTPATLQNYPPEILGIGKFFDLSNSTILDVGANIGQTIVTLKSFYPDCQIIGMEANPEIFETLKDNVSGLDGVKIINLAIGPHERKKLFYVSGHSAKGSFIKNNAELNINGNGSRFIEVDSKPFSQEFCLNNEIPAKYDFIKIDVEGYELPVIKNFTGIKTKAMYLEFSNNREPRYSFFELLDAIKSEFGEFQILSCDEIAPEITMGNILITFEEFSGT